MKKIMKLADGPISISTLRPEDETALVNLIRRNLDSFEEAGSVLASTFRRIDKLGATYLQQGFAFFVVRDTGTGACIGGAGLGPLAGLATSEGIGEIRELVIESSYRRRGIGGLLLGRCLEKAREYGYRRLYLETTPQMENAQKLFQRFGFRPVTQSQSKKSAKASEDTLPCYFMLEDLTEAKARVPEA
jgi:putative acetyltransferase